MNFTEAKNYTENTGSAGIIPGTDVIKELLGRLDNPEKELKVIHVAGTNGKGSICSYLEYALSECGLNVGRYASPSVFDFLERIKIGLRNITEEEYAEAVTVVRKATEGMEIPPTGFEAETAAAFWFFKNKKTDVAIVECGMGGQDDATNVFDSPLATVFASISMDHMRFLGSTPEEIAVNKAGIMRRNTPAIISKMPHVFCDGKDYDPAGILEREAGEKGAVCIRTEEEIIPEGFVNPLSASYQNDNLNTALWTLRILEGTLAKSFPGKSITSDTFMAGAAKTRHPGRFEKLSVSPVIIRDGAHNPGAARALKEALDSDATLPIDKKIHLIMGVFKDKDYKEILRIMLPGTVSFTAIDLPDPVRGLPKEELCDAVLEISEELYGKGAEVPETEHIGKADCLKDALSDTNNAGPEDVYVVFGSLSLMQLFGDL
ncbi:MAG: hypothetical protein J6X94_10210 [Lachnospiraceae bacterium]|nr:hypothetical protein [Lachnospiraceae bacterium]